jgi:hypothetical protein
MKCIFATSMLIAFVVLTILATQFYFASFGMLPTADHFEYIIVGAGPAGSLLVTTLLSSSPPDLTSRFLSSGETSL